MTTERLFVYGTLKPGRSRWPQLEPFIAPGTTPAEATVRGQLWDTGWGWPALTVGPGSVGGVLVALNATRIADAIPRLDEIEGVNSGLFERVQTWTIDGVACWLYRWPGATDGFVDAGGAW